jgi:hypothetical protein
MSANSKIFMASAVLALAVITSANVRAATYTYDLNGTLAEANGGPSLVPYGGTLGPTGYSFGPNTGLSLSGTSAFDVYSIDVRFYFDSVTASFDGYQRILDFKDRTLDMGLYSFNGGLRCFACGGDFSPTQVFFDAQPVTLRVTRDANGLFSTYINGIFQMSGLEGTSTTFSEPNNIIWFFMDDFQTLTNYPNSPEAGSGFIDSITVTTPSPVPLPPSIISQIAGLGLLGLLAWRRKRKVQTAS